MRAEPSILPLRLHGIGYAIGGQPVLSDVTLTVARQRRLVILGPNGAGKSTLLRICRGLTRPTCGRIDWTLPGPAPTRTAMVFQNPVMLRRSVRGNILHALALAGVVRRARIARCAVALERFGLGDLASRDARRLSGGERQRLAIARAWSLRPEVLFLDEPCAQLDPAAVRTVEAMIRSLGEDGITVVLTTHDLAQARRLAQDVAFLHRGRLMEAAPADMFFGGPQTLEAKTFLEGELLW